jgi:hypothetical protein
VREEATVNKHKPASGEEQSSQEGPFRRAYAWPILWGPWVTSVIGLVLLVFGMVGDSPEAVRVTALVLGPLTVVAGLLLPRMQGALELSATGFKGQIDSIPVALVLAHRAAEEAIPKGEPDREDRAWEATDRAVRAWLPSEENDTMAGVRARVERLTRLVELMGQDRGDPPDEPPLAAKPS